MRKRYKHDITVIIPMYNVEKLISETIKSVKQNNSDIEVLLINDGSTDNTLEVCNELVGDDKRFKILSQKNKGVSAARNFGLRRSTGKYIFFVDSDDLLIENSLDKLLQLAEHNDADFVYGGIKRFNSKFLRSIAIHDKKFLNLPGEKSILRNPELYLSVAPYAKLIKSNLVWKNEFPRQIRCAEDQLVIFNALNKAKKIISLGDYIYLYREREEGEGKSITQTRDKNAYEFLSDMMIVIDNIMISNEKLYNDKTLASRNFSNYLERAITFDIWPLFLRVIKYDKKNIKKAIYLIIKLVSNLDSHLVSSTPGFRYFFIKILSNHIFRISLFRDFFAYRKLLQVLLSKQDENVFRYFEKKQPYGRVWNNCISISRSNLFFSFFYFVLFRIKKQYFYLLNKYSKFIIQGIFFNVVKLIPVNKNKVVFIATKNDRPNYDFDPIITKLKKYNNITIKKFFGTKIKFSTKLYRYYHIATSKNIVVDNYCSVIYNLKIRPSTNVIQIWHSCGYFKKFAFSAIGYEDSNDYDFETTAHRNYTQVLASSPDTAKVYSSAFNIDLDLVLPIGVPRTDLFFNERKKRLIINKLLKTHGLRANDKIILYAPTFRGNTSQRQSFVLPFSEDFFKEVTKDYFLFIKLHPAVNIESIKIPNKYRNRVVLLDSKVSVNFYLLLCNILITDYSSLIFEYSLLNKPIIYYNYDFDEYLSERGFYLEYKEYTYGRVAETQEQLISSIKTAINDVEFFENSRVKFVNRFMSSCDGRATKRFIEKFIINPQNGFSFFKKNRINYNLFRHICYLFFPK